MLYGGCLCGAIRWEIDGDFDEMSHCHCSACRKSHGTAFSTYGRAAKQSFRFSQGEERLRRYRSSPPVERCFCSICGSNLLFLFDGLPEVVWVTVGSCDGDPVRRPQAHIFVGSKAGWFDITDALPQYPEYPPHP